MTEWPMFNAPSPMESSCKRILLVEDDDSNRQMLGDYLTLIGYEVHSVATGTECLVAIGKLRPNLILLDLKLPDISGYELLEELKAHPEWSCIPVIVISAYAFRSDQAKALALGARHYLVKPIELEQLIQAIEHET